MSFLINVCVLFGQEPIITNLQEATDEYIRYFSNVGFSTGKIINNNGFLPLLEDTIHDTELAVLTKEELRILRNTIYAKHGFIFQ
jgi:hypothetical protein